MSTNLEQGDLVTLDHNAINSISSAPREGVAEGPSPRVLERGEEACLFDADGREGLDGLARSSPGLGDVPVVETSVAMR